MSDEPERTAGRWATRDEAAAYLRVSPATIGRLGADGAITRHRIAGQLTRYDLDELDSYVLAGRVSAGATRDE